MQYWRYVLLIFMLQGCAQRTLMPSPTLDLAQQQARLAALQQWSIKGKVAMKGGEKNFSASLVWQHSSTQQRLQLSNALGITLATLEVEGALAQLTADDKQYIDTSASHLLLQLTGIDVPFDPLSEWIKGHASSLDNTTRNEQGLLMQLSPACKRCDVWKIDYADYRPVADLWLPHRLDVTKHSDPIQQIKLRIHTWTI